MTELVEIASGDLSAAINPFGAELTHLRDARGRELMTDADPAYWTGHAPILFPLVGRPNGDMIRIDGVEYPMKQHGFARRMPFELMRHDASSALFRLADNEETRAVYPFAFALEIGFAISGATLKIEARIANYGDAPMPASFGWHPAFAWPLPYGEPREDHRIVFEQDEPEPLREIMPGGLIGPTPRPSPLDGRTLMLRDDLFANDALVWDGIHSRRVTYGAPAGPCLDIAFPDTPKLGIWTRPGAHFVCIEPWHGIADPEGYVGDFRDKPGVFEIAPGSDWRCALHVTLTA
ncbi:MAG: aldose epimerase [Sphingomonas bacterium]|uniref:aldose 1-epimerase family protein n=1 Tax=Sphingomonas bacterium TaxID=1895847 RepID=UPI00260737CF|nr:aldose 1-epimerase family protein [Sphingomonas bacterium]MDB5703988.1 aldose epimerase [Sphingomonas bacterium]